RQSACRRTQDADAADCWNLLKCREMLTLYFSPGASSMATHIALNEVGVLFELQHVPLHRHANREPGYLGVNPEGKVPTLMIDGRPLTEVAATLWYLAR